MSPIAFDCKLPVFHTLAVALSDLDPLFGHLVGELGPPLAREVRDHAIQALFAIAGAAASTGAVQRTHFRRARRHVAQVVAGLELLVPLRAAYPDAVAPFVQRFQAIRGQLARLAG